MHDKTSLKRRKSESFSPRDSHAAATRSRSEEGGGGGGVCEVRFYESSDVPKASMTSPSWQHRPHERPLSSTTGSGFSTKLSYCLILICYIENHTQMISIPPNTPRVLTLPSETVYWAGFRDVTIRVFAVLHSRCATRTPCWIRHRRWRWWRFWKKTPWWGA